MTCWTRLTMGDVQLDRTRYCITRGRGETTKNPIVRGATDCGALALEQVEQAGAIRKRTPRGNVGMAREWRKGRNDEEGLDSRSPLSRGQASRE